MNLVVGAKETSYPGWLSTDLRSGGAPLDVRRTEHWAAAFPPASVDRIVAEHVLEHMTPREALAVLCNARRYLKPGGHIRIAVPDAFNPDPAYQEHSRPGGKGQAWARLFLYAGDEPEHRAHYDYRMLSELIRRAGLEPRLLEWHDEAGRFHRNPWSLEEGPLRRYFNSPYNLQVYLPWHGFQNLSLIVDGVKPAEGADEDSNDFCAVAIGSLAARDEGPAARDSTGELVLAGALALGAFVAIRKGWL